jgi:hypothetical protein
MTAVFESEKEISGKSIALDAPEGGFLAPPPSGEPAAKYELSVAHLLPAKEERDGPLR